MGVIRAGDYSDFTIRDNEATKIMTGGPLPNGASTSQVGIVKD